MFAKCFNLLLLYTRRYVYTRNLRILGFAILYLHSIHIVVHGYIVSPVLITVTYISHPAQNAYLFISYTILKIKTLYSNYEKEH